MGVSNCFVSAVANLGNSKWWLQKASPTNPFGAYSANDTVRVYLSDRSSYVECTVLQEAQEIGTDNWVLRLGVTISAWYTSPFARVGVVVAAGSIFWAGGEPWAGTEPAAPNDRIIQITDGTTYIVGYARNGGDIFTLGVETDSIAGPAIDLQAIFGAATTMDVRALDSGFTVPPAGDYKEQFWDAFGIDTTGLIIEKPASASFSATPLSGNFPLKVQFTDESTG